MEWKGGGTEWGLMMLLVCSVDQAGLDGVLTDWTRWMVLREGR